MFPIHILKFPKIECELFSLESKKSEGNALFSVTVTRAGKVQTEQFGVGFIDMMRRDNVWIFEGEILSLQEIASGVAEHLYNTVSTSKSVIKYPSREEIASDLLSLMEYVDAHNVMLAPPSVGPAQ